MFSHKCAKQKCEKYYPDKVWGCFRIKFLLKTTSWMKWSSVFSVIKNWCRRKRRWKKVKRGNNEYLVMASVDGGPAYSRRHGQFFCFDSGSWAIIGFGDNGALSSSRWIDGNGLRASCTTTCGLRAHKNW